MNARIAIPALLLLAAAAAADDAAKPDAPKKPADAPPAKKERKSSPEAEAAFKKYASLLHFPSAKYKTVEMMTHADVATLGGEIGCKFVVKEDGTVSVDVTLSEAAKKQFGTQLSQIKSAVSWMVGAIFRPFLVPADKTAKQYDVSAKTEKDKTLVQIKRFEDAAAWDTGTLTFNAEGLLEKQVGTLNVDPNDEMGALNAGVEIETTLEYKKRGDLYTIESAKFTHPSMGESSVKATYYEIEGSPPFPKELTFNSLMTNEVVISVHDIVVDGKKVAGTERKVEKPVEKKPADPAKPGEPAKPPEPQTPPEPPKTK